MSLINGLRLINIIVENTPDIINQEKEGTVSTVLSDGKHMVIIYDKRKESKKSGEITSGQALVKSCRGTYGNFEAVFLDLYDTKYKHRNSKSNMILSGNKIKFRGKLKKREVTYNKIVSFYFKYLHRKN